MAIKTIIFDFAGVITKTRCFAKMLENMSKDFDIDIPTLKEEMDKYEGEYSIGNISGEEFFNLIFKDTDISFERFKYEFENWYEFNYDTINLIRELKKEYEVTLISDNFDIMWEKLDKEGILDELFEKKYYSNKIKMNKKSKEIFEYVLNEIGKKGEECIFIDDNINNLKNANKVGIKTIHFNTFDQFKEELDKLLN